MQVNTKPTETALQAASSEISEFVNNAEIQVKAIEDKFSSIVPNSSDRQGYEFCKSVRRELMPIKSSIEEARKTLKAPILSAGKLVDGSLNPLANRIDMVMKPFIKSYQDVDNEKKRKEEARIAMVQRGINELNDSLLTASGATSTVIETMIDELADFEIDPDVYRERSNEIANLHGDVMGRLSTMLQQATASEEFEARKRDIELREKAIQDAENIRKKEEEKQLKAQEIKSIEAAAAESERVKIAQQNQEAENAAKLRADDRSHKAMIHNEILAAMQSVGISTDCGKSFIKLVATGKAGNIQINY